MKIVIIFCCFNIAVFGEVTIAEHKSILIKKDGILEDTAIQNLTVWSVIACTAICATTDGCKSVNYRKGSCALYDYRYESDSDVWRHGQGYNYYTILTDEDPCDLLLPKFDLLLRSVAVSWQSANNYCIDHEKKLIVIDSKMKQYCIAKFLKEQECPKDVWIGLKWSWDDDQYKWSNDILVDTKKEFWAEGEPKNRGESRGECVALWRDSEWGWDDRGCSFKEYILCEI